MLDCGFNDAYCMRNNYNEITTIKPIISSNEIINNNKPSNEYYYKYLKYKAKYIKLKNNF